MELNEKPIIMKVFKDTISIQMWGKFLMKLEKRIVSKIYQKVAPDRGPYGIGLGRGGHR